MKKTGFMLSLIFSCLFPQLQLEWQIDQNGLEYGHPYFDTNGDGINELTKQYPNSVTLYDGGDNWSMIWSAADSSYEYFTLDRVLEMSPGGGTVGLFLGENLTDTLSFTVQAIPVGSTVPLWQSAEFPGYIGGLAVSDVDNDGIEEIILGYSTRTGAETYTSLIVVLSGLTGNVEWESDSISGYLYGVYAGDMDNDGAMELIFNRYDLTNGLYTLFAFAESGADCQQGDLNEDDATDILDVVGMVSCILDSCELQLTPCSDLNPDGQLDVLDIVNLVDLILTASPDHYAAFQEIWSVEQDILEYGHLLFDINQDSTPDLTKEWGNTLTVFDGSQAWSVLWYLWEADWDRLILQDLTDIENDDSPEAVITGIDTETPAFNIQLFTPGAEVPLWESPTFSGWLSWIDSADIDEDGITEIIAGRNYTNAALQDSCTFFVLDGATGELLWQSEPLSGTMLGPYAGNLDTDSQPEIVINVYDLVNGLYYLAVYSDGGVGFERDFTETRSLKGTEGRLLSEKSSSGPLHLLSSLRRRFKE
ncbi:MAG: hypothetical protein GXO91_05475 [FCB group bacterium]|nr:hypothetical protein [FCB group bacterium]